METSPAISFDGSRISASGSRTSSITLSEIQETSSIRQKWIGNELSVRVASGSAGLRIRSRNRKSHARFSRDLERAWCEYNIAQLEARSDVIERTQATLQELDDPTRYPAACFVQPALTEAITKFERKQLEQWVGFFDSIVTNPLTPEQRLAVIADEDATLILADAVLGKTSVLTA